MKQTKYGLVKEIVKGWIMEGDVSPGDKISSENEISKKYNVSRHTVRKAISDLVNEGWLYSEQGVGTFCANRHQGQGQASVANEKNIGVVTTYISEYIFPSIIRGIENILSEKGYSILFSSTNNDYDKEAQCLSTMLSKGVSGLIVEPTKSGNYNPNTNYYLNLEKNNIPYVMTNGTYAELNAPYLGLDDEEAGFLATEHLIELGHKKIVGFFKTDEIQGKNRLKGFLKANRQYGIPFVQDAVISFSTENRTDKPVAEIRKILSSEVKPTAIVCYNDELALSIIDVIRSMNLKIPDDISIIGIDDSHLTETSEVKLTSITHPKIKMGEDAANWIINMIEGKKNTVSPIIYKPELVLRSSTAKNKEE